MNADPTMPETWSTPSATSVSTIASLGVIRGMSPSPFYIVE